MTTQRLHITGLNKAFTLHAQGGIHLPVLDTLNLSIDDGECVVIEGPSGQGKSTLLKLIHANYRATSGAIALRRSNDEWIDVVQASEPELLDIRQNDIGYVSQFLRVIPRISALDVVAEPLLDMWQPNHGDKSAREQALSAARDEAKLWLAKLRIPESLWSLPPATFSGGEQQRINIARSLIRPRPLMLLDEPTASLDKANAETVVELILALRSTGCAVLGIFHDTEVRERVATRKVSISQLRSAA
jgi:alpha-D-ribose 1-methylphosphonate 5-triphosphate synthase subunit PhnL